MLDAALYSVSKALPGALSVVSVLVVTRIAGAHAYAVYSYALSITLWVAMLSVGWLNQAQLRFPNSALSADPGSLPRSNLTRPRWVSSPWRNCRSRHDVDASCRNHRLKRLALQLFPCGSRDRATNSSLQSDAHAGAAPPPWRDRVRGRPQRRALAGPLLVLVLFEDTTLLIAGYSLCILVVGAGPLVTGWLRALTPLARAKPTPETPVPTGICKRASGSSAGRPASGWH